MPIDMHPFLPLYQGAKEEPLVQIRVTPYEDESTDNRIEEEFGLIDTGADWCYFPYSYAKKLNVKLSRKNKLKRGVNAAGCKRKGWRCDVRLRVFVVSRLTPEPVFADKPVIDVKIPVIFVYGLHRAILGVKHFLGKYVFTVNYNKKRFSMRHADNKRSCEICRPV